MPRMRIMSWVLFTLSLAFFCVQDFRWALTLPYLEAKSDWYAYASLIPPQQLLALAERAKQNHDAQALAFAAIHVPVGQDVALAEQAVAMDPSLTWIYYHAAGRHYWYHGWKDPAFAATLQGWVAKLQAWDGQNAAPHLLEASVISEQTKGFPELHFGGPLKKEELEALSKQTGWVTAMERAFDAPHYDTYYVRRFDLERKALVANHWARPDRLVDYTRLLDTFGDFDSFAKISGYARLKVLYLAPKAESEKHHDEALRHYYQTALFGQRMQVEGGSKERSLGVFVDAIAAEPLQAALRKDGQTYQSELAAFSSRRYRSEHPARTDPLASSSNQDWAILLAHTAAVAVAFFAGATLLCALYLNAKRWIRVQKRGRLFQFVTGAVNYLAVLVFVSCLTLFLTYTPYATNFHYYMAAPGEVRDFVPLFSNVYPHYQYGWLWGGPDLLLHPVHQYLRWAAIGLVLLALLGWLKKRYGAVPAPPAPAK